MATRKLFVQGLTSAQDAERVNQALRGVFGIKELAMQQGQGEFTISYDEEAASFEDFKQAVFDSGYCVKE